MRAAASFFCGFCRPIRSAKISGHAVRPLKQKTRNAVRHWNTITPERKLRTAAHAPLSGHSAWPHFQWAIITRYCRQLLLGTEYCRFPNPPQIVHMLHGIGLRPISAQDGDFAHCDGRPETLPLDSTTLLKKGGRKTIVTIPVSGCGSESQCAF